MNRVLLQTMRHTVSWLLKGSQPLLLVLFVVAISPRGYSQLALPVNRCELDPCLPFTEVQNRFRDDPNYDRQVRVAYSLEQFLNLGFDPAFNWLTTANMECIRGYYCQYVLGERADIPQDDPRHWFILISHPKSQDDMTGENITLRDRVPEMTELLQEMCYDQNIESGWVSIGNWKRLLQDIPLVDERAFRMTNANFWENGRTVPNSEYLRGRSLDYFPRLAEIIAMSGTGTEIVDPSWLFGNNFPMPGYRGDRSTNAVLKRMISGFWQQVDQPRNLRYFYDPAERAQYQLTLQEGLLVDAEGNLPTVKDADRGLYTLDCMGNFLFAVENELIISHSQLAGGAAMLAAGEIYIDEGNPIHVNLGSGHYKPSQRFLDNVTAFMSPNEYEASYINEDLEAAQAWECFDQLVLTPLDGSSAGSFGAAETGEGFWRYPRRIRMPLTIDVPLGTITQESSMELFVRKYAIINNVVTIEQRTIRYFPSIRNPSKYFLEFGVSDEFLDFSYLEMRAVNGPSFGVAELRLNNCFDRRIQSEEVVTSIAEETKGTIEVYPNPSVDRIFVSLPADRPPSTTITLVNVQGQILNEIKPIATAAEVEIAVGHLSRGVYFIHIHIGGDPLTYTVRIK